MAKTIVLTKEECDAFHYIGPTFTLGVGIHCRKKYQAQVVCNFLNTLGYNRLPRGFQINGERTFWHTHCSGTTYFLHEKGFVLIQSVSEIKHSNKIRQIPIIIYEFDDVFSNCIKHITTIAKLIQKKKGK